MIKKLGLVVLVFVLAPGVAAGQGFLDASHMNWNFLGTGARAQGMGGAFLGVSNDLTAGTWNPAGLVYNESIAMSVDFRVQHTALDLPQFADFGMGTLQGVIQTEDNKTSSSLNGATFVAPVMIREHEFFGSVSYRRLENFFWRVDIDGDSTFPSIGTFRIPTTAQAAGNIGVFTLNTGTSITNHLSIGFGIDLYTGDGSEFHQILQDQSDVDSAFTSGVDTLLINSSADLGFNGVGFNFGAMYRADQWAIGAVFYPGYTLTTDYEYLVKTIQVRRGIVEPELGVIFETEREIDVPWTLGIGTSYNIADNFIVAADYQFRAFGSRAFDASDSTSGYRTKSDPIEPASDFAAIETDWSDLHQIRLGAEFMQETRYGTIPVRAGFRTEPMLIGDQNGAEAILKMADPGDRDRATVPYFDPLGTPGSSSGAKTGYTLTLGTGVHWSQIRFDVAFAYTMVKFKETGELVIITLDENQESMRGTYGDYEKELSDDRTALTFQFTGYF